MPTLRARSGVCHQGHDSCDARGSPTESRGRSCLSGMRSTDCRLSTRNVRRGDRGSFSLRTLAEAVGLGVTLRAWWQKRRAGDEGGDGPGSLVGDMLGAHIALDVAAARPEAIHNLVLYDLVP